jgi:hypothetical protein|tara:strand:+ start:516 stop:722 length:207 start_codon:yes stop_codon:yes gene_type:complete
MKAVLDTSGKTWVPIVVTITIETENEYNALRNIYAVQEVTSLDAEYRVRDRNVITGLINAMLAAIVKK